jgi:hypothetical protein
MAKKIRFVRFALTKNPYLSKQDNVVDIYSLEEMEKILDEADAFIIDGSEPVDKAYSAIYLLRRNPLSCAKPVFLTPEITDEIALLADGIISSLEDASIKATRILARLEEVNKEALKENPDFRLLSYLYARPDKEIEPLLKPFTSQVCTYPLASCLSEDQSMGEDWLAFLKQKGLLTFGKLKDRIRLCPKCETSHLNYIDICPNCGSINIEKRNSYTVSAVEGSDRWKISSLRAT